MSRFKNYLLATAGLVILGGAVTVIGPYVDLGHSKPPQADETMVITLAEDLTDNTGVEFDAVDVSKRWGNLPIDSSRRTISACEDQE